MGNYFTRRSGLHPTPQICFPPPPPPPVGNKTWFFGMPDTLHLGTGTFIYHVEARDPSRPHGELIPFDLACPGCVIPTHPGVPNFGIFNGTGGILGPVGSYTALIDIHWFDGSTSHGTHGYAIV